MKMIVILMMLTLLACNNGGTQEGVIYWVNAERIPCMGVAPRECLQVRRTEDGPWENFYSEIEGFEFEPGFVYKLKVRETPIPLNEVPADASSIRYELIEVLAKEQAD